MRYILIFILNLFFVIGLHAGFVPNKGQVDQSILYYSDSPSCNIALTSDGLVFDYFKINPTLKNKSGTAISMKLIGASINDVFPLSAENHRINYFKGEKSYKGLYSYDTLLIKNIYPNIDMYLFEKDNLPAYDFVLASGADPRSIKIQFEGQDSLNVSDGKLKIMANNICIFHQDLSTYYEFNGNPINSNFERKGDLIGFKLAEYSKSQTIRIDPIVFSTFLGGSNYDYCRAMAVDSFGRAVLVGRTLSTNFPSTSGAYDTTFEENNGFYDVVVSKMDSTGQNLLFSTYIGGYGDDFAECVALDGKQNIYISGYTLSLRNYPVTVGAIDSFDIGGSDIFFTKLSASGDSIIYSTLFGGEQDDFAQGITLDNNGAVYIAGYTYSDSTFRLSPTAYDTTSNGEADAFAIKLLPNSFSLAYSTYIGGAEDDFGQSIVVDKFGYAYIGGLTRSTNFPTTPFGFDRTFNDTTFNKNSSDGFLAKLSPTGNALIFGTYIGGRGKDGVYGICLDSNNNIYAAGLTESKEFPIRSDAFDSTYNNEFTGAVYGDAFILRMKPSGDSIHYSTFVGGRGAERANAISIDKYQNIYITGSTNSIDFPTSRLGFNKKYSDTLSRTDAFVTKLNWNLSKILYSTYLGDRGSDVGNSVYPHSDNTLYVAGWTASPKFPTSPFAFDTTLNDTLLADFFLTKLKPNLIDVFFALDSIGGKNRYICRGDSIYFGAIADGGIGKLTYSWSPKSGVSKPDSAFSYFKPNSTSIYVLTVSDEMGNTARDTIVVNVLDKPSPTIFGPKLVQHGSIHEYYCPLSATSSYRWTLDNGKILTGQGTYKLTVEFPDSTSYTSLKVVETTFGGCKDSSNITIYVGKNFKPTVVYNGDTNPCEGDTVVLETGSLYKYYLWSDSSKSSKINVTKSGKYWVFVTDSAGFGGISDTITIVFTPAPKPIIYGRDVVKPNNIYSYFTDKHSGSTFTWIVSGGSILSGQGSDSIVIRWNSTPSFGTIELEEITSNGCKGRSSLMRIDIGGNFKPKIRILGSADICAGDTVLLDAGYGFSVYQWNTGATSRFITVATADSFYCFVRDNYGFSGWTDTVHTRILPLPVKPIVSVFGNQFICDSDSLPIQWYFNNQVIPNASSKTYIADIPGVYKACYTGANGCKSCSDFIYYLVSVLDNSKEVFVYPNPTYNELKIESNSSLISEISLMNSMGQIVFADISVQKHYLTIHTSDLPSGIYLLNIVANGELIRYKVVKL